jgi:hypothetical protein
VKERIIDAKEPLFQEAPQEWVSLARGPYEFRMFIDGGQVRPGTPDEVLCEWITRPSSRIGNIIKFVRLDRIAGMIELTFNHTNPGGSHPRMSLNLSVVQHNYEIFRGFGAEWHADPLHFRNLHTAICSTWGRMEQEFRFAVESRACTVFARYGAYDARQFTQIPPDVFRAQTRVDWGTGECVGPDGTKLFAVHVTGSKRVAAERGPVASPSKKCGAWLSGLMHASPLERPKPKRELFIEAKGKFGISESEFNRVWATALQQTNASWDKPGAPKKLGKIIPSRITKTIPEEK